MLKKTESDWKKILIRLQTIQTPFQQYISCLSNGLKKQHIVSKRQVEYIIKEAIHQQKSFGTNLTNPPYYQKEIANEIEKIKLEILPEFIQFLEQTYLPKALDQDYIDPKRYLHYVQLNLGIYDPKINIKDIYIEGFKEIYKLIKEINKIAKKLNRSLDFESVYDYCDKKVGSLPNINIFIQEMKKLQQKTCQKLEPYFDIPDIIKSIDVQESPFKQITAYYQPPSADLSKSGIIFYRFEDNKPIQLLTQITTAYHEGFCGHHLQIATQVVNHKLNEISRLFSDHDGGFTEGWALYAEYLMHELDLFDKLEYVIGMLFAQLHRACRVEIDIGIHLQLRVPTDFFLCPNQKWDFDLGVLFLTKIVKLDKTYSIDEVTRYCGIPSQAITYKVGQWIICKMRKLYFGKLYNINIDYVLAKTVPTPLIKKYLKEFHQITLQHGSVSLEQYERNIVWYIQNKLNISK
jgi:uncharacterized protein (DUF885 family)